MVWFEHASTWVPANRGLWHWWWGNTQHSSDHLNENADVVVKDMNGMMEDNGVKVEYILVMMKDMNGMLEDNGVKVEYILVMMKDMNRLLEDNGVKVEYILVMMKDMNGMLEDNGVKVEYILVMMKAMGVAVEDIDFKMTNRKQWKEDTVDPLNTDLPSYKTFNLRISAYMGIVL
ncbi:tRAP-like protein (TREP) [Elysia marginata]|uniref:TRAP-like protein (TREP) n=1 Tax=Elysia marginata TaxID=1093978 RepID=A0AAV4FXG6_9GAST|nr:tRAP-like protein (TREP) [Elysia marginata]